MNPNLISPYAIFPVSRNHQSVCCGEEEEKDMISKNKFLKNAQKVEVKQQMETGGILNKVEDGATYWYKKVKKA